jgi:hypothetical protein
MQWNVFANVLLLFAVLDSIVSSAHLIQECRQGSINLHYLRVSVSKCLYINATCLLKFLERCIEVSLLSQKHAHVPVHFCHPLDNSSMDVINSLLVNLKGLYQIVYRLFKFVLHSQYFPNVVVDIRYKPLIHHQRFLEPPCTVAMLL